MRAHDDRVLYHHRETTWLTDNTTNKYTYKGNSIGYTIIATTRFTETYAIFKIANNIQPDKVDVADFRPLVKMNQPNVSRQLNEMAVQYALLPHYPAKLARRLSSVFDKSKMSIDDWLLSVDNYFNKVKHIREFVTRKVNTNRQGS